MRGGATYGVVADGVFNMDCSSFVGVVVDLRLPT
jgi:hypothetical protein